MFHAEEKNGEAVACNWNANLNAFKLRDGASLIVMSAEWQAKRFKCSAERCNSSASQHLELGGKEGLWVSFCTCLMVSPFPPAFPPVGMQLQGYLSVFDLLVGVSSQKPFPWRNQARAAFCLLSVMMC